MLFTYCFKLLLLCPKDFEPDLSCSFFWNIFLYLLILFDLFACFYALGKTTTSPSLEGVALCRNVCYVDQMFLVALAGLLELEQCRLGVSWHMPCHGTLGGMTRTVASVGREMNCYGWIAGVVWSRNSWLSSAAGQLEHQDPAII